MENLSFAIFFPKSATTLVERLQNWKEMLQFDLNLYCSLMGCQLQSSTEILLTEKPV